MTTWQIVCAVIAYLLIGVESAILCLRHFSEDDDEDSRFCKAVFVLFMWPLVLFIVACAAIAAWTMVTAERRA